MNRAPVNCTEMVELLSGLRLRTVAKEPMGVVHRRAQRLLLHWWRAGIERNDRDWRGDVARRIDEQDHENFLLRQRLAELGQPEERESADALLLVMMPGRMGGAVTIGHSRLPVVQFMRQVRAGWSDEELRDNWPYVPVENWRVVRALASQLERIEEDDE